MRELDCLELYRDAAFYDEEFAEREFEIQFYQRLAKRCGGPILEVACGTGRLTIPLAMAGHQIVGLDVSEPMLRLAKQKAVRSKYSAERHLLPHSALTPRLVPKSQPLDFV